MTRLLAVVLLANVAFAAAEAPSETREPVPRNSGGDTP